MSRGQDCQGFHGIMIICTEAEYLSRKRKLLLGLNGSVRGQTRKRVLVSILPPLDYNTITILLYIFQSQGIIHHIHGPPPPNLPTRLNACRSPA